MRGPCPQCGSTAVYQSRDGQRVKTRCAPCHQARMRAIYATDDYKAKHRAADRRRRRGCPPEVYDELVKRQNGRCGICSIVKGEALRVDHCHRSGRVRQLLCDNCNWGLGNFKDDPILLCKAIAYLRTNTSEGGRPMEYKKEVARSGITFGAALAIAISWSQNGSILWAIIHGIFSWLYVIYYALFY